MKLSAPIHHARLLPLLFGAVILSCPPLRADVVFEWNEALSHALVFVTDQPPHSQARIYALTHLAMEDAMAEARQLPGPERPMGARLAASAAAHAVLADLIPAATEQCDRLYATHAAAVNDGAGQAERARRIGRLAAARILSRRQNDGWTALALFNPRTGPLPDRSPQAADALVRGGEPPSSPWLSAKPFQLRTAAHFSATPPYTVSRDGGRVIDSSLRLSTLFDQVERTALVEGREYWSSEHYYLRWNRLARAAAARHALDVAGEARLLSLLNVALADATIAAQHWRFMLGSWSMMAVERWRGTDGVPPLPGETAVQVEDNGHQMYFRHEFGRMLAPPIVNFPSPIAALAGAAQAAITGFFKDDSHAVTLTMSAATQDQDGALPAARTFASVAAAARECAFVASLEGHTTREACVSGYHLGTAIGRYVVKRAAR